MPSFVLQEIITATKGKLLWPKDNIKLTGVSIDSRTIRRNELFVALRGENFDGHDFINQAVAEGAGGVIVDQDPQEDLGIPVILVPDTLKALGDLACYHRLRFSIPVIGVTGSNGKTTTKELIASVLGQKMNVVKTEKNFNNEIGLPLTLLKIDSSTEAVVVEMGMRGRGQIEYLANFARPNLGVVTNVGITHLELLGTKEAIFETKAELIQSLPSDGIAVLNGDDPLVAKMAGYFSGKSFFYSFGGHNAVPGIEPALWVKERFSRESGEEVLVENVWGEFRFTLPLVGRHNIANALAASIIGLLLDLSPQEIAEGLQRVSMMDNRLRRLEVDGITILDDTYNASPASVQAALEVLHKLKNPGRKIAVLGDMLELGKITLQAHQQIGELVAANDCAALFAYGPATKETVRIAKGKGIFAQHFTDKEELWESLRNFQKSGDAVLVKGSRGMKMEEIVEKMLCQTREEK